ncbi:MAG: oligosaccharide flippase family protein [Vulcanimicrobiaceae bacterium]
MPDPSALRRFARSEFVRHGLVVFVASSLINVFGYAFHFAISRRVGVEQYGVLSALNSVLMLSVVVSAIVATVVVKYAAEFRATDDRAHLAALVRRLTLYGSLAALVVIALGTLAADSLAAYLKIPNVPAVVVTLAVIGISIATPGLRAVFQGIEDFTALAISTCLEAFVKLVVGVGLVYAGYGVVGAFVGWAIGSFAALLYTAVVLLRRFRRVPDATLYIDMRRLVKTMAGISLATVLLASISNVDVLVVKHFADPTTAGLYGALALSGKILLFLAGFVPTIVLPKATRRALAGESSVGVFVQAIAVIALMSGVGLVAYYLFPTLVITTLAGASFAPAAPYVFSYGLAMVFLACLNVVVVYKIGIHRFDFLIPLAVAAVGEIVAMTLHHKTLFDVIAVLIVGNAFALVATAYRVNAPLPLRRPAVETDAAA